MKAPALVWAAITVSVAAAGTGGVVLTQRLTSAQELGDTTWFRVHAGGEPFDLQIAGDVDVPALRGAPLAIKELSDRVPRLFVTDADGRELAPQDAFQLFIRVQSGLKLSATRALSAEEFIASRDFVRERPGEYRIWAPAYTASWWREGFIYGLHLPLGGLDNPGHRETMYAQVLLDAATQPGVPGRMAAEQDILTLVSQVEDASGLTLELAEQLLAGNPQRALSRTDFGEALAAISSLLTRTETGGQLAKLWSSPRRAAALTHIRQLNQVLGLVGTPLQLTQETARELLISSLCDADAEVRLATLRRLLEEHGERFDPLVVKAFQSAQAEFESRKQARYEGYVDAFRRALVGHDVVDSGELMLNLLKVLEPYVEQLSSATLSELSATATPYRLSYEVLRLVQSSKLEVQRMMLAVTLQRQLFDSGAVAASLEALEPDRAALDDIDHLIQLFELNSYLAWYAYHKYGLLMEGNAALALQDAISGGAVTEVRGHLQDQETAALQRYEHCCPPYFLTWGQGPGPATANTQAEYEWFAWKCGLSLPGTEPVPVLLAFESGHYQPPAEVQIARATGESVAVLSAAEEPAWTAGGSSLVFAREGSIWTYSPATDTEKELCRVGASIEGLSVSPDGERFACCCDGGVYAGHTLTGELRELVSPPEVRRAEDDLPWFLAGAFPPLKWSRDGGSVMFGVAVRDEGTGAGHYELHVAGVDDGHRQTLFEDFDLSSHDLYWTDSPDWMWLIDRRASRVCLLCTDGTLRDMGPLQEEALVRPSPSGAALAVLAAGGTTVLEREGNQWQIPASGGAQAADWGAAGGLLALLQPQQGSVSLHDVSRRSSIEHHLPDACRQATQVAVNPQGRSLVCFSDSQRKMWVVGTDDGRVEEIKLSGLPISVAWSGDAETMAVLEWQEHPELDYQLELVGPEGTVRNLGVVGTWMRYGRRPLIAWNQDMTQVPGSASARRTSDIGAGLDHVGPSLTLTCPGTGYVAYEVPPGLQRRPPAWSGGNAVHISNGGTAIYEFVIPAPLAPTEVRDTFEPRVTIQGQGSAAIGEGVGISAWNGTSWERLPARRSMDGYAVDVASHCVLPSETGSRCHRVRVRVESNLTGGVDIRRVDCVIPREQVGTRDAGFVAAALASETCRNLADGFAQLGLEEGTEFDNGVFLCRLARGAGLGEDLFEIAVSYGGPWTPVAACRALQASYSDCADAASPARGVIAIHAEWYSEGYVRHEAPVADDMAVALRALADEFDALATDYLDGRPTSSRELKIAAWIKEDCPVPVRYYHRESLRRSLLEHLAGPGSCWESGWRLLKDSAPDDGSAIVAGSAIALGKAARGYLSAWASDLGGAAGEPAGSEEAEAIRRLIGSYESLVARVGAELDDQDLAAYAELLEKHPGLRANTGLAGDITAQDVAIMFDDGPLRLTSNTVIGEIDVAFEKPGLAWATYLTQSRLTGWFDELNGEGEEEETQRNNMLIRSVAGEWIIQEHESEIIASSMVRVDNAEAGGPDVQPSGSDRIAFVSSRDGNKEIYAMDSDGTNQENISRAPDSDEWDPRWSPDGSRLAFASDRDGQPDIWVMNADGTGPQNLTPGASAEERCSWSPDGTRIAYATNAYGDGEICVMNADGSGKVRLTDNDVTETDPRWSPDGGAIAFSRPMNPGSSWGNWQIFVMNADGTSETRLSNNTHDDRNPEWSPDGNEIVFSRNRHTWADEIWIMNADGSDERPLVQSSHRNIWPSWAPDGLRVVFGRMSAGSWNSELWVINADGSDLHQVTDTSGDNTYPDWSPLLN